MFDLKSKDKSDEDDTTWRDALAKSGTFRALGIDGTNAESKREKKEREKLVQDLKDLDPGEILKTDKFYYVKNQEGKLKTFTDEIDAHKWSENDPALDEDLLL